MTNCWSLNSSTRVKESVTDYKLLKEWIINELKRAHVDWSSFQKQSSVFQTILTCLAIKIMLYTCLVIIKFISQNMFEKSYSGVIAYPEVYWASFQTLMTQLFCKNSYTIVIVGEPCIHFFVEYVTIYIIYYICLYYLYIYYKSYYLYNIFIILNSWLSCINFWHRIMLMKDKQPLKPLKYL